MRGAPVARRVRRRLCACCDGTTPVEECACFACGKGGQGRLNRLERGLRIARRPRPWDRAMGRVSVAAHINTRIRKKYMQLSLGPNVYVGRVVHSEEGHQRALTDAAWQKPPAPAGLRLDSRPSLGSTSQNGQRHGSELALTGAVLRYVYLRLGRQRRRATE